MNTDNLRSCVDEYLSGLAKRTAYWFDWEAEKVNRLYLAGDGLRFSPAVPCVYRQEVVPMEIREPITWWLGMWSNGLVTAVKGVFQVK